MTQLTVSTEKLIELDDEQLMRSLGIRIQHLGISTYPVIEDFKPLERSDLISPISLTSDEISKENEDIKNIGQKFFNQIRTEVERLLYENTSEERETLEELNAALKVSRQKAIAILTNVIISKLELPSNLAIIIAVLIIKMIDEEEPIWRGIFPLSKSSEVLFEKDVEYQLDKLPSWKPHIVIDSYRLEDDEE